MVERQADVDPEMQEETLATPGVVDKYQAAGKIANDILQKVISRCVPDANVAEICAFGDKEIEEEVKKVYNKKKLEKGIAFPTCLAINEICGHFSPLKSEPVKLKEGDLVKVDLGVHIDGFIAIAAHTIIVSGKADATHEGRQADAIHAAYNALQVALRLLKPGHRNNDVTEAITKVCESYKCNAVEGVLSHELKKHLIDGNNCIINKATFDQKVDDYEFQLNEVFGLDIIVSTGEGKPKESDLRCTVYKRAIEKTYSLKLKASRQFFSELNERYPTLAFSLRSFEDETNAKLAVSECTKHELLYSYPVLTEKEGEFVAQFKYTVMVLRGGTTVIAGLPVDLAKYKSAHQITDESILTLLNTSMDKNSQKKDKKKKVGDEGEAPKEEPKQ